MSLNISISIVTYNSKKDILECIDSIKRYTKFYPYKIYISDNNSNDGIIPLIKATHPDITILENKKNLGFGSAHNKVINIVESDYHAIINPDILFTNDIIKQLVSIMESDPKIALIAPQTLNIDGTRQHLPKRNPNFLYLLSGILSNKFSFMQKYRDEYTMANQELDLLEEVEILTGCFMLFKTKTLRTLKGFNEAYFMYFEDLDITRRAKKLGKTIFSKDTVVFHRWERESHKSKKLFLMHLKSMFIYFFYPKN